jgi:general secretion pathway protein H
LRLPLSSRASGRQSYSSAESGFTLLEVLVVVFIIAIVSAFAVLSVDMAGSERELEQEAQRAGRLFGLASQEAIVQGRPMGVRFTEHSYQFLIAGRDAWEEPDDRQTFGPKTIPARWQLVVISDGKRIPLSKEGNRKEAEEPQLLFYPSGDATPLRLIWLDTDGRASRRLEISIAGGIQISPAGDIQ